MNSKSCRCFVPGCSNSEGNVTNTTFYEFPEDLQEEWLNAIGRSRDTFVIDELVCSEHFERTDFENYDAIKTLKRNAIPTLNLPAEREEEEPIFKAIEQTIERSNHLENISAKAINDICTVLKQKTNKTYNHETAPLDTINVVIVPKNPHKPSPLQSPVLREYDSEDEYYLEYEDVTNCRTCLGEVASEGGYSITEIHHKNKTLRDMIVFCIPQMASTLLDTDLVCNQCLESIKFCWNFIENCLKVETELLETNIDQNQATINGMDCIENGTPETYKRVSLDHDYAPEPEVDPNSTSHECVRCDRIFRTKNYLLDHIRRIHSSTNGSNSKKKKIIAYDCEFCDKSFLTKLGYDLHSQLSHRDQTEKKKESVGYTCRTCGDHFETLSNLTEHKHKEHGFTCSICALSFSTRAEMYVHSETHPKGHLCHKCGKRFRTKANLEIHMPIHNDPNTHLCHKCGQGFKSEISFRVHLKNHNPNLKFLCDECPSAFQQRNRLDVHKKIRHLGLRDYICTVCNKKFCYKANLLSHHRLKHLEVKPFQCEECGVRFCRSDYLRRHTCMESGSKRKCKSYKGRKYLYKRDLGRITCKLCDKAFKDVQMLRLHVKTHTKLRKYKCRTCNLTFTTRSNRDRHEKVHADPLRLFRCEICFKKMETREALEEHFVTSHEYSKKYKCHVCEDLFARKYLLHSHVAEKHGDVEDFEREKEVLYKVVLQDYLVDD